MAYGAGSLAATVMITGTATILARATEVAALQIRKGNSEGKSGTQIANDVVDSVFNNGTKVIGWTPITKSIGVATNHALNSNIESVFGGTQTLTATLSSPTGQVMPYLFVAYAWGNTIYSVFCDEPITRANQKGYDLR